MKMKLALVYLLFKSILLNNLARILIKLFILCSVRMSLLVILIKPNISLTVCRKGTRSHFLIQLENVGYLASDGRSVRD